jgi:hypothetical protein
MPATDRLRPHEQTPPAIPRKQLREGAEHDPVDRAAARSTDLAAKHREFMAQHDDLDTVYDV